MQLPLARKLPYTRKHAKSPACKNPAAAESISRVASEVFQRPVSAQEIDLVGNQPRASHVVSANGAENRPKRSLYSQPIKHARLDLRQRDTYTAG